MRQANLTEAKLSGTKYDGYTKWPEGFDPETAGPVLMHDWVD